MEKLRFENLTFSYGNKKEKILDQFNLELPLEGLTALSGPSGCGKTTLLRILAGLEKPANGSISIETEGKECVGGAGCHLPESGREKEKSLSVEEVCILFQEDRLLPWRTVREHLTDVRPGQVEEWLAFAELEGERDAYPGELSGGQARRLALARCCALGGSLMLLDEPFTGVDTDRRMRILGRLKKMGTPMILATHEPDVVAACRNVISLEGPPLRAH
ncbi:MAG: ATP-binding cassette domain-containing protein [Lachnospiraceae bacterium]|nr:ATP-binding cassette domain-containing protein [Lachnospiraceae bacterium]